MSNPLSELANNLFKYLFGMSDGHTLVLDIDTDLTDTQEEFEEMEAAGFVLVSHDAFENTVVHFTNKGRRSVA